MTRLGVVACTLALALGCDSGGKKPKASGAATTAAAQPSAGSASATGAAASAPVAPTSSASPASSAAVGADAAKDLSIHAKKLSDRLEQGLSQALGGVEPPTAFSGLHVEWNDDAKASFKKFLDKASEKKVKKIKMDGYELELELGHQGKKVFHVYTVTVAASGQVKLIAFWEDRDDKWDTFGSSDVTKLAGAPALAGAARALDRLVRSKDCANVPLMTEDEAKSVEPPSEEVVGMVQRSRKDLELTCQRIAALKVDEIRVHVDDVAFNALDGAGKVVSRGKLSLRIVDGKLSVTIPRLR